MLQEATPHGNFGEGYNSQTSRERDGSFALQRMNISRQGVQGTTKVGKHISRVVLSVRASGFTHPPSSVGVACSEPHSRFLLLALGTGTCRYSTQSMHRRGGRTDRKVDASVCSLVVHKRFWSSNYVSTLHFYT